MATATFSVKIGFEKAVAGTFRLGLSKLGSTDVLSGPFTQFFTGAYDDVSADVHDLPLIRRGRSDVNGDMQTGDCELVLSQPGAADFYNPNASTSPLAALSPGFKPMRPLQVTAVFNSVTYSLFYGFIRSAVYDPLTRQCHIHANDLMLWLSRVYPVIASTGPTTTGAAIGKILDAADWTDPALRSLATGDTIADFSADGTKTALDLISGLLDAERGVFFVSGSGVATYQDRHARVKRTVAAATFIDAFEDLGSSIDLDTIKNRATVTRSGGVAQTSKNDASVQTYGPSDFNPITTTYLPDDATAKRLADFIVGTESAPRPPIVLGIDNDSTQQLTQQLSLEIGDRLHVSESLGQTSGDFHIEQIEHTLEPMSGYLTTRYRCSARGSDAFIVGVSKLGSTTDLLTY